MTKIEQKQDELIELANLHLPYTVKSSREYCRLESELAQLKAEANTESLCVKLKTRLVKHLMRNASTLDNPYIATGDISYTRREVASEIENETEFGVRMLADMVFLAIDITSRKGKAEAEKEVSDEDIDAYYPIKSEHTALTLMAIERNKARREGAKAHRDNLIKKG